MIVVAAARRRANLNSSAAPSRRRNARTHTTVRARAPDATSAHTSARAAKRNTNQARNSAPASQTRGAPGHKGARTMGARGHCLHARPREGRRQRPLATRRLARSLAPNPGAGWGARRRPIAPGARKWASWLTGWRGAGGGGALATSGHRESERAAAGGRGARRQHTWGAASSCAPTFVPLPHLVARRATSDTNGRLSEIGQHTRHHLVCVCARGTRTHTKEFAANCRPPQRARAPHSARHSFFLAARAEIFVNMVGPCASRPLNWAPGVARPGGAALAAAD